MDVSIRRSEVAVKPPCCAEVRRSGSASPDQVTNGADGVETDQSPEPLVATHLRIGAMMKVALRGCHQPERDGDQHRGKQPLLGRTRTLGHLDLDATPPTCGSSIVERACRARGCVASFALLHRGLVCALSTLLAAPADHIRTTIAPAPRSWPARPCRGSPIRARSRPPLPSRARPGSGGDP